MFISPATTPPASPTSDSPHDRNTLKCHTPQKDAPGCGPRPAHAALRPGCRTHWFRRGPGDGSRARYARYARYGDVGAGPGVPGRPTGSPGYRREPPAHGRSRRNDGRTATGPGPFNPCSRVTPGELADHSQGRPPKGPAEQDDLCGYQHLDVEHWLGKYSALRVPARAYGLPRGLTVRNGHPAPGWSAL